MTTSLDLTTLLWLLAALASGFWLLPSLQLGRRPYTVAPVVAMALSGRPLLALSALALGLGAFYWRTGRLFARRREKLAVEGGVGLVAIAVGAGMAAWLRRPHALGLALSERLQAAQTHLNAHVGGVLGSNTIVAVAVTVFVVALAGAAAGAIAANVRKDNAEVMYQFWLHAAWYATAAALGSIGALLSEAVGAWLCLLAIVLYGIAVRWLTAYESLQQAHNRTVDALSVVTGSSDPHLTGHARRVARYATAIAKTMQLSRRQQHMLEYAALLHNLGVLEAEWELDNRPGTLTEQEVEQIRRATLAGADIVARFGYYPKAADYIRYHLEPYEKAPNAPLGARILAVANALDAMLVRNRWRRSLTLDEAIDELHRGAGTQFDPKVVEAMLRALSEDAALRQLATDPYSILVDQPRLGGMRPGASSPAAQAAMTVHNTQLQRLFEQTLRLLAATKSHTELILDSLPDAVFTTDLAGELTFLNRAAARLAGMETGAAAGQPASAVFGQSVAPGDAAGMDLDEFLQSTRDSYEAEVTWRSRDGDVYPARVQFARLTDEGQLVGAVARIEDRSEIRRLQEQVQRAERLAILGELAASVAHEIRNPLAIIRGFAEHLPEDVGNQPALEESVATILREVDRLDRVIGSLLAFARPSKLEARYVDLNAELDRILTKLQPQADSQDVTVVQQFNPLPEVFCDHEKLEQVFLNLLFNALQVMPDGGTVTVRTQLEPADAGGQQVAIYISDTGPGIPPGVAEQIFQPFFTTRRKGTGLGLSISARILEEHGGRLALVESSSEGTTFGLWLPA